MDNVQLHEFAIYCLDTCIGTIMAINADEALRLCLQKYGWTSDAGMFAELLGESTNEMGESTNEMGIISGGNHVGTIAETERADHSELPR